MSETAAQQLEAASAQIPPPPPRAFKAAYASAFAATIGFIPLHAVWALGIPLWADDDKFRQWYEVGGGPTSSYSTG